MRNLSFLSALTQSTVAVFLGSRLHEQPKWFNYLRVGLRLWIIFRSPLFRRAVQSNGKLSPQCHHFVLRRCFTCHHFRQTHAAHQSRGAVLKLSAIGGVVRLSGAHVDPEQLRNVIEAGALRQHIDREGVTEPGRVPALDSTPGEQPQQRGGEPGASQRCPVRLAELLPGPGVTVVSPRQE